MLHRTEEVLPFARLLRQARLSADLTQEALAERAGLSVRAIQHLEAGRGHPYADTARRLADALGLGDERREIFQATARRKSRPRGTARSSPRHNLPDSLTSFIGRRQETLELRERVATARLLTLTGAGGCGKTRLALEVARTSVDDFRDGAWLVELASLDGTLVGQQVASVLGVSEVPGQPLADVLASALRDSQLLLVLDNCEHVVGACANLAHALLRACPRLHILATSRSVLGAAGETIWSVPSLSLPDARHAIRVSEFERFEAVRLFVERARAAAPTFRLDEHSTDAVARICWRLDGIPLALELAAARVRTLGVAEVAYRLDDCMRLLVGGDSSRPPRQQTLRAAVDWSYDLLTPAERELFMRFSVFAGGATLEAVEAVCEDAGKFSIPSVEVLEQLVDKSLVIAEPGTDGSMRYRSLETLRQYASARLDASGQADEIRARHAAFYCRVLPRWWRPAWWGPDVDGRLTCVVRELDNLRVALRWLIAMPCVEAALQLGYAMAPFWLLSARVTEGRAWLAELRALHDTASPSVARAGVLIWSGALATQDGEALAGRDALAAGLGLARASGDQLALAFALMWLAIASQNRQELAASCAYAEESLAVSRASGYQGLEGMNLRILAQAALEAGDLGQAWRLADESLIACRAAGHPPGIAWALSALGQVRFRQAAYAAARDLLEASLGQGLAMGAPTIRLNTLVCLSWTLLEQSDPAGAAARGAEALAMARSVLGGRQFLAAPLEAMAQVSVAAGQPEVALRLTGAAARRREAGTAPITPTQREQLERWLSRAHAAVDPASANAAWIRGGVLSDDEAIADALAVEVP